MGRIEKSKGLAPPAVRKDIRAKQARHIVNKVIPAILASNPRARRGAEGSELIVDPPSVHQTSFVTEDGRKDEGPQYIKRKGQGRRKARGEDDAVIVREEKGGGKSEKKRGKKRKESVDERFENLYLSPAPSSPQTAKSDTRRTIRVMATDTLTAAHILTSSPSTSSSSKKKEPNTCVLNMASSLRPGGGVLTGATSQEEFLCARTTLLPSLRESFYRLPEIGGIFTRDVLVFRNASPLGDASGELGPGERYWVDVVSAGMLRFPELEGEDDDVEAKRLGKKDREVVEKKMRAVLRIAQARGVRKNVLGAWGCGAYGNPVEDIARAWRTVLGGEVQKKGKAQGEVESWDGLEEVVFAISNRKMAEEFASLFEVEVETGPGQDVDEDNEEEQDAIAEELRTKIQEMEGQIAQVWNADLKARMGTILQGLREQFREKEAMIEEPNQDEDEDLDESGDKGLKTSGHGEDEESNDGEMHLPGSDGGTDEYEILEYDDASESSSNQGGLELHQ